MIIDLALVLVQSALLSFGGGLAVLPELERQIVVEHGWLSHQDFATAYALGQATPGPAILFMIPLGYRIAGFAGALVAPLAFLVPPGLLVLGGANVWRHIRLHPWARSASRGLGPVVIGLVAAGVLSIARVAVTDVSTAAITVIATLLIHQRRISGAAVVLGLAIGGAVISTTLQVPPCCLIP